MATKFTGKVKPAKSVPAKAKSEKKVQEVKLLPLPEDNVQTYDAAIEAITTQKQIDNIAEKLRAQGMPDDLNRWLTMTPEKLKANEAERTRIVKQSKNVTAPKGKLPKATGLRVSVNLEPEGKKLLAEMEKAKEAKKAERLAALKTGKAGPKEAALRVVREAVEKPAGKGKSDPAPSSPAAAKPASKAAKAAEKASRNGRKGAFAPEVVDKLLPMVKEGTTVAALIKTAKWGDCPNPARRVSRFIATVLKADMKMKVTVEGEDEKATVKAA